MSKTTNTPAPTRQEIVTDKVATAYETARVKTTEALHTSLSALEANPIAALLGGIALGAAAGALIPRGDREKALLAPLGDKLAAAAAAAIAAGREAGTEALKNGGFDKDSLRDQVSGLFGEATKAATAAGAAAFAAGRDEVSR